MKRAKELLVAWAPAVVMLGVMLMAADAGAAGPLGNTETKIGELAMSIMNIVKYLAGIAAAIVASIWFFGKPDGKDRLAAWFVGLIVLFGATSVIKWWAN